VQELEEQELEEQELVQEPQVQEYLQGQEPEQELADLEQNLKRGQVETFLG
jgi:hypothetical protein